MKRTLAVFAVALSILTPACRRLESRSTFAGAPVIIISIATMRPEAGYQIWIERGLDLPLDWAKKISTGYAVPDADTGAPG